MNLLLARHFIKLYIEKSTSDKLKEVVLNMDQESYDKLFWAMMERSEAKEFKFSMKDYLSDWKLEFDERYSSIDMHLVIERLGKIKDHVDQDLNTEYHYLKYWFDKECQVGGLFSYY